MGDVRTSIQSTGSSSTSTQSSNNQLSSLMDHLSLVPSRVSFVRSSSTPLERIASLNENEPLVLFTPFVPPPTATSQSRSQGAASNQNAVDPFETLGRDLAERHRCVQHVPFRPSVGIMASHEPFVRNAGAIIIVIWGSAVTTGPNEPNPSFLTATVAQRAFADAVRGLISGSTQPAPIILFITGTTQRTITERDFGNQLRNFENILHSQVYNQLTSRQFVEILFQRY